MRFPMTEYAWLTAKHKWFVFLAGLRIKTPLWQLVVHDLSKFGPSELPHYGRQFFGDRGDPLGFAMAWNHHQKANKHHWEYWVPETSHGRSGFPDREPLPMPERYAREMVADWLGAARAYEGSWPKSLAEWKWMRDNYESKVRLHPQTRAFVDQLLRELFL